MAVVDALASALDDPFSIFPLHEICRRIADLVGEADERAANRSGWWGVSPKFRSVEDEHDVEVRHALLGAAFVLAQTAITQTAAVAAKIRMEMGNECPLVEGKTALMNTESRIHANGATEIALIYAVANYFKHHHEWPAGWVSGSPPQRSTIMTVQSLGLSPAREDNLEIALQGLGLTSRDLPRLTDIVQTWRERLAAKLRGRSLPPLDQTGPEGLAR